MDLSYTAEEDEFRARLREWLGKALPTLPAKPSPDDWPGRRAYDLGWQRMLYDAGYGHVHWDASPTTRLIFLEETEKAGAPYVGANFVGLLHAGPTIAAEGTPEQRERWLPPVLRGDEVWCQGFSEPEAGSDLAALRTRAWRDGDDYVVSGSKIWTSHAEVADWCELLVRTDAEAPKHRGSAGSRCRCPRRGSPYGRCGRWPGPRSSPRCSSTRCGCLSGIGWGRERWLARDHGDAVVRARYGFRG